MRVNRKLFSNSGLNRSKVGAYESSLLLNLKKELDEQQEGIVNLTLDTRHKVSMNLPHV